MLTPTRFAFATAIGLLLFVAALPALAADEAPRLEGMPEDINDSFLSPDMKVEEWVERFEGESRAVYARRNAIVESLEVSPGDAIADVGAGTGFFSVLLGEAVGAKGRVYAVEISPKFLDHLRELKQSRKLDNVVIVEGSAKSVELEANSVDLAFICDVYHHFEHPQDSLASLREAIRPGGSLVVIEFHRIEGKTPDWLMEHVRAGRDVFQAEIEAAGFTFSKEIVVDGLDDNYILRFQNPKADSPAR